MWDLTVDIDHDFYVAAGADSVLVHNCKGKVTLSDDQIDTHVLPRHGAGTPAVGSKFDDSVDPDDLEDMANEVVSGNPNIVRKDPMTGNHTHEGDLGRVIGEKGETKARVWVTPSGEVTTIHPIR